MTRLQSLAAVLGLAALASATLDCKTGASNGTIFSTASNTYDILCNYRYGGDIIGGSRQASTFDICVGFCDTTAGCVDVFYDNSQSCYLKSSKKNGHPSPNRYTAVKRTAATTTSTPAPQAIRAAAPISPNCADGSGNGTIYDSGTALYDITCNYQYNGANLGSSKKVDTFATCIGYCDSTSGCVDVVYSSSAKTCRLKSTKLAGYSSLNSWVAVKRPGPNLVANPGFETVVPDTTLPSAWYFDDIYTGRVVHAPAAHSGSALEVLYSDTGSVATISQTLTDLDTTRTYSLSFYYQVYRASKASATLKCTITASVGGSTIYTKAISSSDATGETWTWVSASGSIKAGKSSQDLLLQLSCPKSGKTYNSAEILIDDVSFNTV